MHFPHPIRHKFLYLFIALILYFISNALLQEVRTHYLVSLFFTILIIFSLLTVANYKKILTTVLGMTALQNLLKLDHKQILAGHYHVSHLISWRLCSKHRLAPAT